MLISWYIYTASQILKGFTENFRHVEHVGFGGKSVVDENQNERLEVSCRYLVKVKVKAFS